MVTSVGFMVTIGFLIIEYVIVLVIVPEQGAIAFPIRVNKTCPFLEYIL